MECLIDKVSADEKLARIVLKPRDLDPVTRGPKESFISLRNGEEGVSFLRFDFMGETAFMQSGVQRAEQFNKNQKKPKYSFEGWMEGIAGEIASLSPELIRIVVNNPKEKPEHVNLIFEKDGEIVKGIVTDAEILELMDDIFHSLKYVRL